MVRDAALTSESAAVAATSYDSSSSIWSKISSPLKSIPGPWYTSMNSGWYNVNLVKGTQLFNIRKLHKQHGPLVRVAPNIISVADPDAIRAMMSTHRFQKGNIYDGFQFGNKDNIFSTRDPDFYKTRRRLVAPAFTPSAINEMESVILDAGTYSLSAILEKHAEQQDVINMFDLFSFMTFDAMSEVMFGKSFGLLHGDNHPVLDWIQDTLMLGIFKAALGSISKSSVFSKHHESERKLIDFAVEAIRKRKESEPRSDSLQRLMDARDEETDHSLEEREVATELIVQFIAGTDTTSCSLSWILYSLTQHPDCMKRLQAELDETIPDVTSHVTHAMVKDLPYLNAVCDEGLRLHSVAAGDPHRTVPPEGVELCGRFIPGGTTLIPQIYTLHHSENYWIKPDEFIPERWLTKSSEDLQAMRRCYMPFSVGVRACVGRSLAWAELRVTLAVLLRRFDFTFVPGANMEPHHRFIVRPTDGKVDVRVTKRAA